MVGNYVTARLLSLNDVSLYDLRRKIVIRHSLPRSQGSKLRLNDDVGDDILSLHRKGKRGYEGANGHLACIVERNGRK